MFSSSLATNRSLTMICLLGISLAARSADAGGGRSGWLIPAQPAPAPLGAPIGYIPAYPVYASLKHQLWHKPKLLSGPLYAPAPSVGYWQPAATPAQAAAPAPATGYWQAAPAPTAPAPAQPTIAAAPSGESAPTSWPSDYVSNGTWHGKLFVYWNGKEYVSKSWSSSKSWSFIGAAPSDSKRARLSSVQQTEIHDGLKQRRRFLEDAETPKDEVRNALQSYAQGAYQDKTGVDPDDFNTEDKAAITDLVDSAMGSSEPEEKPTTQSNQPAPAPQPTGYYYYYAAPAPSHHHGHGYRPGYLYGYPY